MEATCVPTGATWAGLLTTCADTDMNGMADVCEGAPCPADIDGDDDDVDFQDLPILLNNWGACP